MHLKKLVMAGLAASALAAGALALTATAASARVVCNSAGDCWHTDANEHYPGAGYVYHPDDWYFHQTWDANHHWRDYHTGRGYYRGGLWITL